MSRITFGELFDTVEVDLDGHLYTLREGTKTVSAKLLKAQRKTDEVDENDPDALAVALIEVVDVLLAPTNGAKSAKALLTAKWKADEVGLDRLTLLAEKMQEEAQQRGRPTSLAQNGG